MFGNMKNSISWTISDKNLQKSERSFFKYFSAERRNAFSCDLVEIEKKERNLG